MESLCLSIDNDLRDSYHPKSCQSVDKSSNGVTTGFGDKGSLEALCSRQSLKMLQWFFVDIDDRGRQAVT